MYSPIRRNTRKQGNTSAFDRKLASSKARKIDIIIKEEGNKEEVDVKKKKREKKKKELRMDTQI